MHRVNAYKLRWPEFRLVHNLRLIKSVIKNKPRREGRGRS